MPPFLPAPLGEKLRHDAVDACAPGVQETGAEAEERKPAPIMLDFNQSPHTCRHCGGEAVLSSETWSDGLHYADVSCRNCGRSYVLGGGGA